MKDAKLNILILEDVAEDAELALYELKRAGFQYEFHRVDNLKDFKFKLFDFLPHVVLSDYNLPTCSAIDAFELVKEINLPFIIVSGIIGEENAVEALKLGVTDLVSKDSLSRLPIVVERALNEQKVTREKKSAEHELILNKERLELALEGTDLGIWDLDFMSNAIVYNNKSLEILGFDAEDAIQDFKYFQKYDTDEQQYVIDAMNEHIAGKAPFFDQEFYVRNKTGAVKWVLARGKIIRRSLKGEPLRASGTLLDISEKKVYEEQLRKNQSILENAESVAHVGSYEWNAKGNTFVVSAEFRRIFELEDDTEVSVFRLIRETMHEQDKPYFKEMLAGQKDFFDIEHRIVLPDDMTKIVRNTGNITSRTNGRISSVLGVVQDITEQREISKSIFNAQQFERSRMARDIHDGIGQMLVAAKFKLSSLEADSEEELTRKKDDVEDLLATTIEEVRRVSRNLSNRHLEEFGLSKTMHYLMEEIENMGEFEVDYIIDIPDDYDMELSNTIYRIAQEAISNIVKYAKAEHVSVRIEPVDKNIVLEIKDDGIGFDSEIKWNGIKNMKERTSLQNGHFEITSVPKKGTVVKSWFPINN
ncbi:PAS domain S-box-containing protein [Reichenbachiella faecimaris]|uniref:PAS domain S-box-containing protein n=1 Tax=Reichenbachiella faecimaris TaxID=692418 RepID=A0A1W2GGU2_REIFA|nr:PAS domain-containing protein [Reichenbachiella faecimaris]SMD35885.1 PAS domain S-box-containing protein [Reichenbachiella faecimaris]